MINDDDFTVGFEDAVGFELIGETDVSNSQQEKNSEIKVSQEQTVEKRGNPTEVKSHKYTYETIYQWFIKGKNPTTPFEQYLRTKPEVYLLFDLIPFQPLPSDIMQTVDAFVLRCFQEIDKNLTNNNEAIEIGEQIKKCLQEILLIYKYYYIDDCSFETSLKHNLFSKLYVSLKEKEFDGVLELSEIETLLKIAKQLYLWDGKSEVIRQEILAWIKENALNDGCKIESYGDTFVRKIRNKPSLERLNADHCIRMLYMEYRSLKCAELEIHNQPLNIDDKSLYIEMKNLLDKENLLKDREETYMRDFFNIEKARSRYDYSLKLPSDYYQYLKTVAISTYLFNEEEWDLFAKAHKLFKLADMSVAFILGTQKASSLETIATLLENNTSKAVERIIDGDLETYLIHIEQHNLAKEIAQSKTTYKNDKTNLLSSVVNILRGIKGTVVEDSFDVDDRQTLLAIIERDAPVQEMVQYLLKRKTREKLNQRILSDSNDRKDLNEYIKNKNLSFICLCLNYLRDFPNESNASGYTNIYEMYANYVLDTIIEKNAFNLFFSGYIHLINMDYISQSLKDKINNTNIKMQKDFEEFCNTVNKKNKKRSIFGF